jgi:hypothetical protein
MLRRDGEVFLFGTAIADKLLQKPDSESSAWDATAARQPFVGGGQNERRSEQ